jgi:polar amino acid transport system substrate-binding protein
MSRKSQISLWLSKFAFYFIALSYLPTSSAQILPQSITVTSTVYPPFIINDDGILKGIDFDIAKEAGRRVCIQVDLQLMPWGRIAKFLKAGSGSLESVVAFFKTPARQDYMVFTDVPLHITKYTLFVRSEDDIVFNQLSDLRNFKGYTIGVNRSFKTTAEFKQAQLDGIFKTQVVKNDRQNFGKLTSGRIDAVLTNYHVGSYTIKHLNLSNKIKALPLPLSNTPAYMVFAKSAKLDFLVPKFNTALKAMQQDGTYKQIYEKYGIQTPYHRANKNHTLTMWLPDKLAKQSASLIDENNL